MQGASANLLAIFIIGNCFNFPRLIFTGKSNDTVIHGWLMADFPLIDIQRDTGSASIDLHIGLLPLTALPAPAFQGIRHFPSGRRVLFARMVHGTDRDSGACLQLERYFCVECLAQWLAS